jgi:hypothetical protein
VGSKIDPQNCDAVFTELGDAKEELLSIDDTQTDEPEPDRSPGSRHPRQECFQAHFAANEFGKSHLPFCVGGVANSESCR